MIFCPMALMTPRHTQLHLTTPRRTPFLQRVPLRGASRDAGCIALQLLESEMPDPDLEARSVATNSGVGELVPPPGWNGGVHIRGIQR